VPPLHDDMQWLSQSWSSGVHGADLHGGSRIVRMSKWLTMLLHGPKDHGAKAAMEVCFVACPCL
jgi:hypothetical protein